MDLGDNAHLSATEDPDAGQSEDQLLSLTQVADQLGVHYMTVYRHVRTGKLAAIKQNGEWRVAPADLVPSRNQNTGRPGNADIGSRQGAFTSRIVAADEPGAWSIIENCLAAGATAPDIHHELILPVLRSIGEEWRVGKLSIRTEHMAMSVVLRLVSRLGPMMRPKGRTRGTIVIGAIAGDNHSLPSSIVADYLRSGGYEAIDLGANTPAESFRETVLETDRLRAVGLSSSVPVDATCEDNPVSVTIRAIREVAPALPILVGGVGITDAVHAKRLGADGTEDDSRRIVEAFDHHILAASGASGATISTAP